MSDRREQQLLRRPHLGPRRERKRGERVEERLLFVDRAKERHKFTHVARAREHPGAALVLEVLGVQFDLRGGGRA